MTIPRNLSFLADLINTAGTIPLSTINEVQISNPANNQLLVYDSVSGKWKNNSAGTTPTPASISGQINTATDFLGIPKGTTAQRPTNPDLGIIRYNTSTGFSETYTSNGWAIISALPPTVSTVSPGTYNGEGGTTFTINGTGFTSDALVKFVDVNNTEYSAGSVTFISTLQLTATTPQDFTVAQGPLDVIVSQLTGTISKLNCISTGGTPSWSTSAGQIGGTIYRNASVNTSAIATDPDSGATITYSVYSGALPSGVSLNANTGAITGTAPNISSDTTYNFTLRATDNAGNTADRAFSMIVLQGAPGTPTIGTATTTSTTSVNISFTAPVYTGGSAITQYTATSSPGGIIGTVSQAGSGSVTVSGLTSGTAYTFTVTATNSYGTSSNSVASNSATTWTIPGTPTIGTATQTGITTATVTYTAPASNGGTTITSYTAVSSPGNVSSTVYQTGSGTISITGLSGATNYTFTVYATSAAGNSSTSSASNQITTQAGIPSSVEYLVVAGGGGGGGASGGRGGGGGAGGMLTSTLSVSASTGYTVSIGGGGTGSNLYKGRGTNGSASQFASISTVGGGGGAGDDGGGVGYGSAGGSGGGGHYDGAGGAGTGGQGNSGGSGITSPNFGSGGGGGAGGAGQNGQTYKGGDGGIGSASSINGTYTFYAGGGGGQLNGGTAGSGGTGGGGSGNGQNNGGGNLGGGGGGNGSGGTAGAGGSGVVIIAYPDTYNAISSISGGLAYDQPSRAGYRVYRFYAGTGTISW